MQNSSELVMDTLQVALSYAPLGVRDAAHRSLGDLLGGLVERPLEAVEAHQRALTAESIRQFVTPDEAREKLQAAYNDALVFFSAIAGERANGHQTHEQTAREWLMRWGGAR